MAQPQYLGIEIGGTKLQIVAGDPAGGISHRWRASVERGGGADVIRAQLEHALRSEFSSLPLAAIAVGFGGPVDRRTGRTACSHQVGGWNDFPLRDWLAGLTRLPVAVENDSNLAALGEFHADPVRPSPLFYFNLGSGVGGGLIVNDAIYHGSPPGECEFGHLRLDRAGNTVESRCSGWAIDQRIRGLRSAHPDGLLATLTAGSNGGEAKRLPEALRHDDPRAHRILFELADDLAFALSHAVHLFHPRSIILGGGLSLIGEPLRAAVADALPQYVMDAFHPPPLLYLSRLGEDAVPAGALHLAASLTSPRTAPLPDTAPPRRSGR